MKKALVVAVVVLVVVVGLPVLVSGMAGAHCAECGPATLAVAMCLAVLAAAIVLVVPGAGAVRRGAAVHRGLLRAALFERPPQPALVLP